MTTAKPPTVTAKLPAVTTTLPAVVLREKICERCTIPFLHTEGVSRTEGVSHNDSEAVLCIHCSKNYIKCNTCNKIFTIAYSKYHTDICAYKNENVKQTTEGSNRICNLCKEDNLEKFKLGYKICRSCYNEKQRKKIKCSVCLKMVNNSYLRKHLRNKHNFKTFLSQQI